MNSMPGHHHPAVGDGVHALGSLSLAHDRDAGRKQLLLHQLRDAGELPHAEMLEDVDAPKLHQDLHLPEGRHPFALRARRDRRGSLGR